MTARKNWANLATLRLAIFYYGSTAALDFFSARKTIAPALGPLRGALQRAR
jgi:hypothetical protein